MHVCGRFFPRYDAVYSLHGHNEHLVGANTVTPRSGRASILPDDQPEKKKIIPLDGKWRVLFENLSPLRESDFRAPADLDLASPSCCFSQQARWFSPRSRRVRSRSANAGLNEVRQVLQYYRPQQCAASDNGKPRCGCSAAEHQRIYADE